VPSRATQAASAASAARVAHVVQERVATRVGATVTVPPPVALTVEALDDGPAAEIVRPLWLGPTERGVAGVIRLRGLSPGAVGAVEAVAGRHPGARLVDRTAVLSDTFARCRRTATSLLAMGVVVVGALLVARFGRRGGRALLPTLLGIGLAFAVLAVSGVAVGFFHVMAAFLVLGMGVDYGILLLEHDDATDGHAWMAVSVGALSTLASFGLLALSSTPALRAFGEVLGLGIGTAWLAAPFCCPPAVRTRVKDEAA
jgi:predicted exporter